MKRNWGILGVVIGAASLACGSSAHAVLTANINYVSADVSTSDPSSSPITDSGTSSGTSGTSSTSLNSSTNSVSTFGLQDQFGNSRATVDILNSTSSAISGQIDGVACAEMSITYTNNTGVAGYVEFDYTLSPVNIRMGDLGSGGGGGGQGPGGPLGILAPPPLPTTLTSGQASASWLYGIEVDGSTVFSTGATMLADLGSDLSIPANAPTFTSLGLTAPSTPLIAPPSTSFASARYAGFSNTLRLPTLLQPGNSTTVVVKLSSSNSILDPQVGYLSEIGFGDPNGASFVGASLSTTLVVPEPARGSLLLIGFSAFIIRRRRKVAKPQILLSRIL